MAITTQPADITLSNGQILPGSLGQYKGVYERTLLPATDPNYLSMGQIKSFYPQIPDISTFSKTPEAQSASLLNEQKSNLASTLGTQKDADLKRLDDLLASRGISQSGAVAANQTDISGKYAQALASGNVALDTANQNYLLQQQNADMMSKYYGALTSNLNQKLAANQGPIYLGENTNPAPLGLNDPSKGYGTPSQLQNYQQGLGGLGSSDLTTTSMGGQPVNTTKKAVAAAPKSNYQLYV